MLGLIPIHDDNPTRRPAVVNWTLIAINVVVFFISPISPIDVGGDANTPAGFCRQLAFFREWAAIPVELLQNDPLDVTAGPPSGDRCVAVRPDYHKIPALSVLSAMFLHGGLLHLARQHAVPVRVRQQRRGPARPGALPALLPGLRVPGDLRVRPLRPGQRADSGRGVGGHRRGARRLPGPVSPGPGDQPGAVPVLHPGAGSRPGSCSAPGSSCSGSTSRAPPPPRAPAWPTWPTSSGSRPAWS